MTAIPPTEFEAAKAWRFKRGLTMEELSQQIGYSVPAVSWFERGLVPPIEVGRKPKPVSPRAWHRYKMLCSAVEYKLRQPNAKEFQW